VFEREGGVLESVVLRPRVCPVVVVAHVLRRGRERFHMSHVGSIAVEGRYYRGWALGGEEVLEEVLGVIVRTRGTRFQPWGL